jgi:CelD/BcsL family acetyltransferase involved in cellulose biosynthesis
MNASPRSTSTPGVQLDHRDRRGNAAVANPPGPGPAGRRHRRRDTSELVVERVSDFDALASITDQWRELYVEQRSRNAYAAPEWLTAWARHFVAEPDLAVLTVRRRDELVGVAPWYVRRVGSFARSLQLLGTARHDSLTELPQVLAKHGESRSVLRAVMGYWSRVPEQWDWAELPLSAEQGWFEPEWLTGPLAAGIIQHKVTRAAVVLPLPEDATMLRGRLKRNLLESVNRGRNRLDRTGRNWTVRVHSDEREVLAALPRLASLHAARAVMTGRRRHPDELAAPQRRAFLDDAVGAMARREQAEILTLDVEGTPVAAQLVLHAPGASHLGMSGVDPQWWDMSPVTLLQFRAAELAIAMGHAELNLSLGPSVAKLRWSEHIEQHPEFLICGPRARSRALYTAVRVTAAAAAVRRESRRHQVSGAAARPSGAGR